MAVEVARLDRNHDEALGWFEAVPDFDIRNSRKR
jgi:hypothetical protein